MGERMRDKAALVTGATSNIGRAIAIGFAAEGANVVVSGRSSSRGAEVVQEITSAGGRAQFVAAQLDGSARASSELSHAAHRALGGRIDVLVDNAGIFPGSTTRSVDEAMFDEVSPGWPDWASRSARERSRRRNDARMVEEISEQEARAQIETNLFGRCG